MSSTEDLRTGAADLRNRNILLADAAAISSPPKHRRIPGAAFDAFYHLFRQHDFPLSLRRQSPRFEYHYNTLSRSGRSIVIVLNALHSITFQFHSLQAELETYYSFRFIT